MHDPDFVLFAVRSPIPRRSSVGRRLYFPELITIWHGEPDGRDTGSVCKGGGGTGLSWHNIKWGWKHRKHLWFQVQPYLRVKRWLFTRCADCGFRFFWKQPRFGAGWDSPETLHESCSRIRQLRCQIEDMKKYIRFEANDTERWRVEKMYLKQALNKADTNPQDAP